MNLLCPRRLLVLSGWLLSPVSLAVGLGEISVHSALGQPLNLSIRLLGESKAVNTECFRLHALADNLPAPAQPVLEYGHTHGRPVLQIRTLKSVNEPALAFSIELLCDARVQRDYTVLLDLPASQPQLDNIVVSRALSGWGSAQAVTEAIPPQSRSRPTAARTPSVKAASKPRTTKRATRPVLKISSGSASALSRGGLFRMDTNLPDLTRKQRNSQVLSETQLHDENTALMHKLDHLERQLRALQQRNTELQTRLALAQTLSHPPEERSIFEDWIPWLIGLAGLLVSGAGIAWLLHHKRSRQTSWQEPEMPETRHDPIMREPIVPASSASAAFFSSAPSIEGITVDIDEDDSHGNSEAYAAQQHTELAIQRLEEELRQTPEASPVPWLLLLDLLHHEQLTDRYNATRQACMRYFNVRMPAYGDILVQGKHGIESHPHLAERLIHLWPEPETSDYLNALLRDNRGGTRSGFDLETFNEILLLQDLLKHREPDSPPIEFDFDMLRGRRH